AGFLMTGSLNGILQAEDTLTLYTQRHYAFDETLHAKFLEETGIKVEVVKAGADELIARLQEEGENTSADLFMTADGAGLARASDAGLLEPMGDLEALAAVPESLKGKDGEWCAVTMRARVIVHASDRVDPSELSTYEALADPKWKGRIVIRSSTNAYNQSLMASIVAANGEEKSLEWAKAVRGNMARPPQGSDRDQIRAVASGLADIAVANTYYLGLLANGEDENDRKVAKSVKLFFPNQDGRGAHVNISGVGVVKGTKNMENALKFISFLLSEETQSLYPENTFEYPVLSSAKWSGMQEEWGKFKPDTLDFGKMGEKIPEAVRLFNEAGWE
ncbi:MAG: extracellular solute-binding protein, partial [Verrucomicrobiota bacterium]